MTGHNNCRPLQETLGYRDIFQIDETESANQNICWYKRKCRKVANICGYDSFPAFVANPKSILQKKTGDSKFREKVKKSLLQY